MEQQHRQAAPAVWERPPPPVDRPRPRQTVPRLETQPRPCPPRTATALPLDARWSRIAPPRGPASAGGRLQPSGQVADLSHLAVDIQCRFREGSGGSRSRPAGGFDWGDAGIGAAGGFALWMIGIGGAVVISQRRTRSSDTAPTS
jgi:hypothetical protein